MYERCTYLVTYDISDPRRWRKVFKLMHGFGEHVQYSVFRCDLVPSDLIRMKARLVREIHHREDQVIVANLGPSDGRGEHSIEALGRPYTPKERDVVVV